MRMCCTSVNKPKPVRQGFICYLFLCTAHITIELWTQTRKLGSNFYAKKLHVRLQLRSPDTPFVISSLSFTKKESECT